VRGKQKNYPILEKVEITDAGVKGKNIGRAGGLVVLVDNAIPGDIVDVKIRRKKKGFAEGSAIHIHEYSKDRVQPVCSHFAHCGGCSWQNMNYEKQLFFKQKAVEDALTRIGKLEFPPLNPIAGSAKTEYYRNRLDYAFSNKKWLTNEEMHDESLRNSPGLGFHVSGKFDKVLDLSRCYLQEDPSNPIRLAVREFAIQNEYPFFDLREQNGSLRSLIVRTTAIGEIMLILIFYKETEERIRLMMDFILNRFPEITSLYYVLNPKANDTVYDLEHHLYAGKSYMTELTNGIRYRIGPKSFYQTNSWQAEKLYSLALAMADLKPDDVVFDLYTGVGSIALQAAGKCKKVIGIETVAEAIDYAKLNAADNKIDNTLFFAGDVKDILTDDFIAEHGKPDVIITDPPRVGMDISVVKKILEIAPEKIIYVSCNPATQARDLELMKDYYRIDAVQPVDMFPQTYHVENIVVVSRQSSVVRKTAG
jgi:23S rRNA (uracil1939-C5)-methyltransferase